MSIKAMIESKIEQMEIDQILFKEAKADVPESSYSYAKLDLSIALKDLCIEILKAIKEFKVYTLKRKLQRKASKSK